MALAEEQKKDFAKGFNAFLERTKQSRTDVAEKLGVTPQVVSGWSRAVSVPSYEMCQKLLSIEEPMFLSELFGTMVSSCQIYLAGEKYINILIDFENKILDRERDLSIKDFQNGDCDYRKLIQDYVEAIMYMGYYPDDEMVKRTFKKAKKLPNVYEAIQAEMNLWSGSDKDDKGSKN